MGTPLLRSFQERIVMEPMAMAMSGPISAGFRLPIHCPRVVLNTSRGYGGGSAASANGALPPHTPTFHMASPPITPVAAEISAPASPRHVLTIENRLVSR